MASTPTTTKRTTKAETPTVDPIARLAGEDIDAYVLRLQGLGTSVAFVAARDAIEAADYIAETDDFYSRIHRSKRAGDQAVAHATFILSKAPTSFAEVAKALDIDDKNGRTYAGKAYSTLRECYRMSKASGGFDDIAEFVQCWTKVEGRSPQNVRDALQWLERIGTPEEFTENTVAHYSNAKAERAKASQSAASVAESNRQATKAVVAAGYVEGVDLTPAQWAAMSPETLDDIARLATVMAAKARKAAKADTTPAIVEAVAREVIAETGPVPTPKVRKPRTKAAA